jgi:MoxR-like ATPase
MSRQLERPDEVQSALREQGYLAELATATVVLLGLKLEKPLLVEGPAGVGKTALATSWAKALGRELIRLQCYDGLDENRALYEWSYGKQLLATQLVRESLGASSSDNSDLPSALSQIEESGAIDAFFSERFLIPRPLLQATRSNEPVVLLIDEVDRADEAFEALLLETLSDYQVSIPELGPLKAVHTPIVVLTSNSTRDLSDALKRRCLHIALDFPSEEMEREIVRLTLPDIDERLAAAIVETINQIRLLDLRKRPSVGETLDWARALMLLGVDALDKPSILATTGVIAKYASDADQIRHALAGD